MCMCLSVLYLWYTTTYKYISTSQVTLIFTPTLQTWIANVVVIDVFITTLTRWKSVLKAWSIMLTQRAIELAIPQLQSQ